MENEIFNSSFLSIPPHWSRSGWFIEPVDSSGGRTAHADLHLYNIVHEAEVVRLSAEGMSIKSGNEVKCRPAELPPIEVTFIFCFFQRIPASQLLKGLLGRWAGVCLWKNMSRGVIKYLSSCLRRALGTRLWLPSVLCEVILSPLLCGCHQMLAA